MSEEVIITGGEETRLDAEILQRQQQSTEAKEAQETAEAATPAVEEESPKQPYTTEEMKSLDADQIDTSRIPPELLPFYRAMQAPITRKSQQLSEAWNQIQQYQQQIMQQPAPQQQAPPDILELHRQNPQQVYGYLDKKYLELAESDPFEASKMLAFKTALLAKEFTDWKENINYAARHHQALNVTAQAIMQVIPEWNEELSNSLREFALNDLGYTPQEIAAVFDPQYMHPIIAAKNVKAAYDLYKQRRADSELQQKKVRRPTRVESAGSGFKEAQAEKWSHDDYFSMRGNKAIL